MCQGTIERIAVSTKDAPAAIGPYSQAVLAGNMLFISGQIPINPGTGEVVAESFAAATRQCLENMRGILRSVGGDMGDLVKVEIFTTDMGKFAEINEVYATYFDGPPPARAVVEVSGLPKGVPVEIQGTAMIDIC